MKRDARRRIGFITSWIIHQPATATDTDRQGGQHAQRPTHQTSVDPVQRQQSTSQKTARSMRLSRNGTEFTPRLYTPEFYTTFRSRSYSSQCLLQPVRAITEASTSDIFLYSWLALAGRGSMPKRSAWNIFYQVYWSTNRTPFHSVHKKPISIQTIHQIDRCRDNNTVRYYTTQDKIQQ